jgi:hypothetical protein
MATLFAKLEVGLPPLSVACTVARSELSSAAMKSWVRALALSVDASIAFPKAAAFGSRASDEKS